jgi:hypothetical protein
MLSSEQDGNGKNREVAIFEERVRRQRIPLAGLQSECKRSCSALKLCMVGQRHVCETNRDEMGTAVRHGAMASPSLFDAAVDPVDGTCWTSRRDDAWRGRSVRIWHSSNNNTALFP